MPRDFVANHVMKLARYLRIHQITAAEFARMIGIGSRETIHRYMREERCPDRPTLWRIHVATRGCVSFTDFIASDQSRFHPDNQDEQDCEYHAARNEKQELEAADAGFKQMMGEPCKLPRFSPPLQIAIDTLGSRLKIRRDDGFILDGKTVSVVTVVRAANEILRRRNVKPIHYPGVNPIHE